jgi:hypothetical protein
MVGALPLLLDLPSRDDAREAARRELSKRAYRAAEPSWIERLARWLFGKVAELLSRAGNALPGGGWALVLLVLVVGAVVALLVVRLRPARRVRPGVPLFEGERERTAEEHRDLAGAAAARGDYAGAVQERFRAVVRELERRGVLDPRPGRTADEVAWEAGSVVPALRDALVRGARLFDDVRYGERPADEAGYAVLVALDDEVGAARLALA